MSSRKVSRAVYHSYIPPAPAASKNYRIPAPRQPDSSEMQAIEALRNVLAGRIKSLEVLRECVPENNLGPAQSFLQAYLQNGEDGFWQAFERSASMFPLVAAWKPYLYEPPGPFQAPAGQKVSEFNPAPIEADALADGARFLIAGRYQDKPGATTRYQTSR